MVNTDPTSNTLRVTLLVSVVSFCLGACPAFASPAASPRRTPGSPTERAPASLKETMEAEARGDLPAALAGYHSLIVRPQARHVRVYLHGRVRALVAKIPSAQLPGLLRRLPAGSPVRSWLLLGQASALVRAGKEAAARRLLRTAKGLSSGQRRQGLVAAGDPGLIGALVPLSGRLRSVGLDLLRGMILAAGLSARSRGSYTRVEVRDSASDPAGGAAALARLGVVAVVGVPWSPNARLAAPVCSSAGLPLLVGADGRAIFRLGSTVFRAVHSPTQRARALAAYLAATRRVTRVAILHPPNGYGRRVAKAFADRARRSSLVVVATVTYRRKDPALYKQLLPLARKGVQAVFVADSATHLELVAPQLGLAGLLSAPLAKLGKGKVLLLSTAEGLRSRLVRNVSHSVDGAVLAPGFYADPQDPKLGSFVRVFAKIFGRPPGRYAAMGYLSVQRIRSLLVRRARGRVSLVASLAAPKGRGRRGIFDKGGERTDPPRLYRISGGVIRRIVKGARP